MRRRAGRCASFMPGRLDEWKLTAKGATRGVEIDVHVINTAAKSMTRAFVVRVFCWFFCGLEPSLRVGVA